MKKVVVGIVPTYKKDSDNPYEEYNKFINLYSKEVFKSGGIPIGILLDGENLNRDSLEVCDAFIIPGGNKVYKYAYEIILYAIQNNKPLLGICLGAEAIDIFSVLYEYVGISNDINDYLLAYKNLKEGNEGTLLKKLPINNYHSNEINSYEDIPRISHNVNITKNSIAYSIFNNKAIFVPSMHSYTFKYVGRDFKITGYSDDDIPEIIEYNDKNYFIVGLHFHPEIIETDVFNRLIKEAYNRKFNQINSNDIKKNKSMKKRLNERIL